MTGVIRLGVKQDGLPGVLEGVPVGLDVLRRTLDIHRYISVSLGPYCRSIGLEYCSVCPFPGESQPSLNEFVWVG